MNALTYNGQFCLNQNSLLEKKYVNQDISSPKDFNDEGFYISNSQLVKFKSKDYILIVDGRIFEFDSQSFFEDQYHLLVDWLSKDFKNTVRKLNGEYTIYIF